MNWFERIKSGLRTRKKKDLPSGVWLKCDGCKETLYNRELERNSWVCPKCNYHFRISSQTYIKILVDEDTFEEMDVSLSSVDPLKFKDRKRYTDRLKDAEKRTGKRSAIQTGIGRMDGKCVALGVMDFGFIGGSMGSVVGEKIARLVDTAMKRRLPLIIVSTSGGARMMESTLSLMQMTKTCTKLAQFTRENLLYISILTNPCTAGVLASFGSLGDVIFAEPGALIGFSGPRVIKETIGGELPEGFQTAEFMLEHGFVDRVVPRKEIKKQIVDLIELFSP